MIKIKEPTEEQLRQSAKEKANEIFLFFFEMLYDIIEPVTPMSKKCAIKCAEECHIVNKNIFMATFLENKVWEGSIGDKYWSYVIEEIKNI